MVEPALSARTLIVNGVSKAYAMTGWRIGYAAGPTELIAGMRKLQSQSTSNPSSISQAAAECALLGDQSCVVETTQAFKHRHDLVLKRLNALPGFQCAPTDGAFYLFPSVEGAMAHLGVNDDIAFCDQVLTQANVALIPGSAFGLPGHVRLSYATSPALLETALDRLQKIF